MCPVEEAMRSCFFNPNLGMSPWLLSSPGAQAAFSFCPRLEAPTAGEDAGQEQEP